jgi:pimeloyl-ACP methyl ester carboxylesterase
LKRQWRWWLCIAAIAALAVCVLGGFILCEGALRPARRHVPLAQEARTVGITAQDGVKLQASVFEPEHPNGDAVLVLHGIGDSRGSQAGPARMLTRHGYLAVTPDSRAHGDSGGDLATYGLREADDVHRWVDWLIAEKHARRVFGFGESLGGAVLIQSLAVEPRFSGIIADSAFSDFERVAEDRVAQIVHVPRWMAAPPVWAGFLVARLRYGLDFRDVSPESAIAKTQTPVLLIHGMDDEKTPSEHSKMMAAANPEMVRLWLVPGAGHVGAWSRAPEEFERRVIGFYQNLPPGIQVREK